MLTPLLKFCSKSTYNKSSKCSVEHLLKQKLFFQNLCFSALFSAFHQIKLCISIFMNKQRKLVMLIRIQWFLLKKLDLTNWISCIYYSPSNNIKLNFLEFMKLIKPVKNYLNSIIKTISITLIQCYCHFSCNSNGLTKDTFISQYSLIYTVN